MIRSLQTWLTYSVSVNILHDIKKFSRVLHTSSGQPIQHNNANIWSCTKRLLIYACHILKTFINFFTMLCIDMYTQLHLALWKSNLMVELLSCIGLVPSSFPRVFKACWSSCKTCAHLCNAAWLVRNYCLLLCPHLSSTQLHTSWGGIRLEPGQLAGWSRAWNVETENVHGTIDVAKDYPFQHALKPGVSAFFFLFVRVG